MLATRPDSGRVYWTTLYLAASYIAPKLRRNKFKVFEHLNFDDVVKKFPQVFVFVCGLLHEEASVLFAQIGEKLKSDWDWLKCSRPAADFFIESWSESGNAEGMANTLCSFIPFPRFVGLYWNSDSLEGNLNLINVLLFCRTFSKVEVPEEIIYKDPPVISMFTNFSIGRNLASLPNLTSLDISNFIMNDEVDRTHFQILTDFAYLKELVLPHMPEINDWEIVAETLTACKTLEKVTCTLVGERGDDWARALGAGLCADTPLSSVNVTFCGPMSETALDALENLLLNKSLSSMSVIVMGDMSHSLAVTLARCITGQSAVKSLELLVKGKLSFCCANLIEQGIIKNNSLSNFALRLHGELPDNWQAIVDNLNLRLAEKTNVTFEIYPNTTSHVTVPQLIDVRPWVINCELFERESVILNVWGELTVDSAEALYKLLLCPWMCHLTLNIHGKLTDDFLHCTARYVDEKIILYPITINTWEQLTNEEKALFKELGLDKNPAVTLNVCDVHLPSDEWGDDKIVSIDNHASLIALFEEAENTGKENLTVTINVQSDDSTYTGRSWNDSLLHGLPRNCSLTSLTLTMNNFSPRSTELSLTLIGCLEGCSSLKSLTLTLNEYNKKWENTYASRLREGLGRNTSLISLTFTLNICARVLSSNRDLEFDDGFVGISDDYFAGISDDDFAGISGDDVDDILGDDVDDISDGDVDDISDDHCAGISGDDFAGVSGDDFAGISGDDVDDISGDDVDDISGDDVDDISDDDCAGISGNDCACVSGDDFVGISGDDLDDISDDDVDDISDDNGIPNISGNSFTLTINDFSRMGDWGLSLGVLWPKCKPLNTFNLTLNSWDETRLHELPSLLNALMTENSTRLLRLKINGWTFRNVVYPKFDFSELVEKSPSLELIELTICRYGDVGSWQETLKWEKEMMTCKLQ